MKLKLENNKIYSIIMIACFIYSGLSLGMFVFQVTSVSKVTSFESFLFETFNTQDIHMEDILNDENYLQNLFQYNIIEITFYINLVLSLLGFLISLVAGIYLLKLIKDKESRTRYKEIKTKKEEVKEFKEDFIESVTMPEEKIVIQELKKNNNELTQSELVKKSGLSKVKIHRIIKRLEKLKIIEKLPYGMTNKIKLKEK